MARSPGIEDAPTIAGEGRPPDEPEPPQSRGLGWGVLLGALVVVAAAGIGAAVYFTTRDGSTGAATTAARTTTSRVLPARRVYVPDVTGLEQVEAARHVAAKGLAPTVRYRPTGKPTGLVVEQRPKPATQVRRGSKVTIVVDRGAPATAVPDLVGLEVAAAGRRLARAGLNAQTTPVTAAGAAPGTVVSQSPAAGTKAKRGSVVTLSVARNEHAATAPQAPAQTTTAHTTTAETTTRAAPAQVSVPDVGGGDLTAAAHAVYDAGLRATVQYVPAETPLESVVAQSPSAGTTARARSRVTVNVSTGPGDKPEQAVPDVVGRQVHEAVTTLNGAGLRLIFVKVPVTGRAQVGRIVAQTPAAGASAPPNAQVLVELGVLR